MDSCKDSFSCTDSKLAATTMQGIKAKIQTQLWATCEDLGLLAFTITRVEQINWTGRCPLLSVLDIPVHALICYTLYEAGDEVDM